MAVNIRIFGCSFTQGIENLERFGSNWVHFLKRLVGDKVIIYNYSQAGTGASWHSFLLSQIKLKYPNDIYIVQLTTSGRYAWWPDETIQKNENFEEELFTKIVQHRPGLFEMLIDHSKVKFFNYGTVYSKDKFLSKEHRRFAIEYYNKSNEIHNWGIHTSYLINNSDFSYFHSHKNKEEYMNYFGLNVVPDAVSDVIGREVFQNSIIDNGDHLSDFGNKCIARYVYKTIKGRLIQ